MFKGEGEYSKQTETQIQAGRQNGQEQRCPVIGNPRRK